MATNTSYVNVLNDSLKIFFKDALKVSLTNPAQAWHFLKTVRWQQKAARKRKRVKEEGIQVPPILIFSITNRCNLRCKGCYAQALRHSEGDELSDEKMCGIITEAHDLGMSFMVIAGGEPLVRQELFNITRDFPDIIFLLFTNGLLIDDQLIEKLKTQKNVVPVISLEGHEADTDDRRGSGVYGRLLKTARKLKKAHIFYAVSFTVTKFNFDNLTDAEFIRELTNTGCKLFFFLEYSPIQPGTEDWLPTDAQRGVTMDIIKSFRRKFPALFISVPGDEEEIGGCISAGRGFVHINANGDLEPCPFAPYSDASLKNMSLKEALKSDFLEKIRDNHDFLSEVEGGGCALWVKRDWVKSVLEETQHSTKAA
ncbi:radical SAM protein [candidate division KSB1 bacterium]|nr:radical SAM protein [candidate division KSB1 bacterium]